MCTLHPPLTQVMGSPLPASSCSCPVQRRLTVSAPVENFCPAGQANVAQAPARTSPLLMAEASVGRSLVGVRLEPVQTSTGGREGEGGTEHCKQLGKITSVD